MESGIESYDGESMRTVHKVSTPAAGYFEVYDSGSSPVTGLVNGDFTKLLAKNGTNDGTTVTVAEVGTGRYYVTFTPATTGLWHLLIRHATYNTRGWQETFDVTTGGVLSTSDISNDLLDLASAIDGQTPRATLKLMAAALCGKVSGMGSGSPVFRNMSDTADRIIATTNSDGNRTAVSLLP